MELTTPSDIVNKSKNNIKVKRWRRFDYKRLLRLRFIFILKIEKFTEPNLKWTKCYDAPKHWRNNIRSGLGICYIVLCTARTWHNHRETLVGGVGGDIRERRGAGWWWRKSINLCNPGNKKKKLSILKRNLRSKTKKINCCQKKIK